MSLLNYVVVETKDKTKELSYLLDRMFYSLPEYTSVIDYSISFT